MTEGKVCDSEHIIESMQKMIEEEDEDSAMNDQDGLKEFELTVYDTEARMVAITHEEMEKRNLTDWSDNIFILEWKMMKTGGAKLTLKFHESVVEKMFSLRPAGPNAIDPVQATQPQKLGGKLYAPISKLNRRLDINTWDFCKVDGASIANGGYITDYEFEYDAFCKDPTEL